jgi:hypothetical protein
MKLVRRSQGSDNRILHEIVCAVAVLGKKPGKSTQVRNAGEKIFFFNVAGRRNRCGHHRVPLGPRALEMVTLST